MWQCEICGKEFQNMNQNHFCKKAENIDEYITAQREDIQPILIKVRETIKSVVPNATEKIKWSMPTFTQGKDLIHFCAHKNHLGIHPGAVDRLPFKEQISKYTTSKGAIQFPYNEPIDYDLIKDIVRFRLLEREVEMIEVKEDKTNFLQRVINENNWAFDFSIISTLDLSFLSNVGEQAAEIAKDCVEKIIENVDLS